MRRYHLAIALLLVISLSGSALPRQPGWLATVLQQTPAGASEETKSAAAFEALRAAGVDSLYNLDYVMADVKFEEMIKLNPDHPAGHFYLATSKWLSILNSMRRLQTGLFEEDSFFASGEDKVDPQLDREGRAAIAKAINVAQSRYTKNRNDAEALYYLGAAYGLFASYKASVTRNFRSAMHDGNEGVKFHKYVIKLDPGYADAYLSIGLYNYVVGKLPWLVRVGIRIVGVKGSPNLGLSQLRKAMDQGRYVSDDARVVLIAIHQREKNYSEALKLLDELSLKYPRNYLYSLERAALLGRMGKSCESYAAFNRELNNERAQSITDLIHYQYGRALFDSGEFKSAIEQFSAVIKTSKANAALVSLAYLHQGQSLDATGQRASALEQYQNVLKRENVFDSHNLARRHIKRPFTPEKTRQEKCAPGDRQV